jgi:gas vesicle protein
MENHSECLDVTILESPSSHSGHHTSDGLEIWRISHIPQKDEEFDMMLISCNILLSTMFTEIEHLIKEMIENIGKIRQNRDTNSSVVKEQKQIIENEIQELRTTINNHLDKLQEDLMKKLAEAEKNVTTENQYFQSFL